MNESKTTSVFAKSEFWITAVTSISGLLMAFGIITPEQGDNLVKYVPNIIGAVMSLLSSFKFVGVQHAAKVEVFRASCAMKLGTGSSDGVTAQSSADVCALARSAGL